MGAGAIWLPFSFTGWLWMPRAVKISGWIGLAFSGLWLIVSAVGSAWIDSDGLVTFLIGVGSAFGTAMSAGMLRRKRWAYRGFVGFIWFGVVICLLVAVATNTFEKTAWMTASVVPLLLWRLWLTTKSTRMYFGLAPEPQYLLAPAYVNLLLGANSLLMAWPVQPTPVLGFWLKSWQVVVVSLAFGVGSLWLGWGLLKAKSGMSSFTICYYVANVFLAAAIAWAPNPQGRLATELVATRLTHGAVAILATVQTAWTLWRIHLHNRQRLT